MESHRIPNGKADYIDVSRHSKTPAIEDVIRMLWTSSPWFSQYCTHRRLLNKIHHDNVHHLTADVSIHRDPLVMVRTPRPKSQTTKTRRTSTWIHLVIRRVLSCREDQSGRALGCSCSVPNFVEVLSLLYDPNQTPGT